MTTAWSEHPPPPPPNAEGTIPSSLGSPHNDAASSSFRMEVPSKPTTTFVGAPQPLPQSQSSRRCAKVQCLVLGAAGTSVVK